MIQNTLTTLKKLPGSYNEALLKNLELTMEENQQVMKKLNL